MCTSQNISPAKGGVGAHINAMIDRYKLFYKDDVGDDNDYCDDDDDDGVIVVKRQLTYSVRMHIDVQIKYNHVTTLIYIDDRLLQMRIYDNLSSLTWPHCSPICFQPTL